MWETIGAGRQWRAEVVERLYGWREDEAEGRNIVDLSVAEPTRTRAAAIMAQVRAGRPGREATTPGGRMGRWCRSG